MADLIRKRSGIDTSSPEPIRKAMEVFRDTAEKMRLATS